MDDFYEHDAYHSLSIEGRPVYIKGSRHVPPDRQVVRDAMPALFELLSALESASVETDIRPFAEFVAERVEWSGTETEV